jgi:hypothetical protein
MAIYRNRLILNQRGGALDISNETEQEKIKISQRSGSNINLTNVVTSELATNNKQTNVVHDLFETVGGDTTLFTAKNYTFRTGENSFNLKGFIDSNQMAHYDTWTQTYKEVALLNSEFKILRGGEGYPDGAATELKGERSDNPVINSKVYTVENKFNGYIGVPVRNASVDEVTLYVKVPDKGKTKRAEERKITEQDVLQSAGSAGSKAPGVLKYGPSKNAATEQGTWEANVNAQKVNEALLAIQERLNEIEQLMGHGGDEISFIKRDKFEQVGAVFNDFPSVKIDPEGRSQPYEVLVSETGTYHNHDFIPHVEEIDNSSNFPCGSDDKVVGNRYSRTVGSGGIQMKSTGTVELGGTVLKAGFKAMNLNATHGIQIASEASLELASLNTISLRSNRQVYVESALGVKNNLIVGGGLSVEGELYCQHITAPLEVHQTEDTILLGKFAADEPRKLLIGECNFGGVWYPVYASSADNLIVNYPHSHHHNGIPLRLTKANKDVRNLAAAELINTHNNLSQALPQNHERKVAVETAVITE